jgi:hypothetical protein
MFRYQGTQQLPRDDIDEAAAHWTVPKHFRVFSVPVLACHYKKLSPVEEELTQPCNIL